MRKLPADSTLGPDLRKHRKGRGLTRRQLAAEAGVAERTVRLLEQGQGNLDSWRAALGALGVELIGRNLPSGPSLGMRLAKLRSRGGLGQRELAAMVGVTPRQRQRSEGINAAKITVIIAVSGYGQVGDLRRSREAGFNHHSIKPVDFESLVALIGRTHWLPTDEKAAD